MNFVLSSLIFLCSICLTRGEMINCTFSREIDVYNSYDWPNNTFIAPNQDCTFVVVFNKTAFLNFDLSASTFTKDDLIIITDQFNNDFKRSSDFRMQTAFPPPSMNFRIVTGSDSRIELKLKMLLTSFSLDNVSNTLHIKPSVTIPPIITNQLHANISYVIESDSNVALTVVDSSRDLYPSVLMGAFVYEGTGPTAELIGTLYGALSKPIVSTRNVLTVYSALETQDYFYMISNVYSNIQSYSNYGTGWTNQADLSPVTHFMGASRGRTALTIGCTMNEETYLTSVTFTNSSATLSVISGAPTSLDDYQIVTYNADTIASYLPQQFPNRLTTFVLSEGNASLVFTGSYSDAEWETTRPNRMGYVMTTEYPSSSPSPQQFQHVHLGPGKPHDFHIKLLHFDKINNADNNLTIEVNNTKTFSWPLSTIGNQTIELRASSIDFELSLFQPKASGTMLSFEMKEATPIRTTAITMESTTTLPTNTTPKTYLASTTPSTTMSPTTSSPTTTSPSTNPPTTNSPTSDSPTTFLPTTNSPTTTSPATSSPTTLTNSPTSISSTTSSPSTTTQTTSSIGTTSPTTSLATNDLPTTYLPSTNLPTTTKTTTFLPTTFSPSPTQPKTSLTTTNSPPTDTPLTTPPAMTSPTTIFLTASLSTTNSPIPNSPTTSSPTTFLPTTSLPSTTQPTTNTPISTRPTRSTNTSPSMSTPKITSRISTRSTVSLSYTTTSSAATTPSSISAGFQHAVALLLIPLLRIL